MFMETKSLKFIFFGSSEFSLIVLNELLANGYLPLAVVTAPDQLVGRKQVLTATPVKILALEKNIPLLQPEKLDELVGNKNFCSLQPELFIVASYGKIIPKNILDLPKFGSLNVHPSLLPKYRGASPIQAALLNGDKETGVTIMLMDEKMDHGPILSSVQCSVSKKENFLELHNRLAETGAKFLIKTLPDFLSGKIKPKEQNHEAATFCKIIKKQDGKIDWQKSAEEIYNQWRAYSIWPGIYSQLTVNSKQLTMKFIEINTVETRHWRVSTQWRVSTNANIKPGEFFVENKNLFIACGHNSVLKIIKLQLEGKNIMTAIDFINGYLKNLAEKENAGIIY